MPTINNFFNTTRLLESLEFNTNTMSLMTTRNITPNDSTYQFTERFTLLYYILHYTSSHEVLKYPV